MPGGLLVVLAVAALSACRYAAMLGLARSVGRRPLLAALFGGAWVALFLLLAIVLLAAGRRDPCLLALGGAAAAAAPLALAAWALARGLAFPRRAGRGREGRA